jgi:hypothetical protein
LVSARTQSTLSEAQPAQVPAQASRRAGLTKLSWTRVILYTKLWHAENTRGEPSPLVLVSKAVLVHGWHNIINHFFAGFSCPNFFTFFISTFKCFSIPITLEYAEIRLGRRESAVRICPPRPMLLGGCGHFPLPVESCSSRFCSCRFLPRSATRRSWSAPALRTGGRDRPVIELGRVVGGSPSPTASTIMESW